MRYLAFALFMIVLSGFGIAVAVVSFHFRKYVVPGDRTTFILHIFLAGSVLFAIAAILLFLSVPWDALQLPNISL